MKKNNISFILSILLLISPQLSMSRYDYAFVSAGLQSMTSFVAKLISSHSKETQFIVAAIFVGLFGYAMFLRGGSGETSKPKKLSPTDEDISGEKLPLTTDEDHKNFKKERMNKKKKKNTQTQDNQPEQLSNQPTDDSKIESDDENNDPSQIAQPNSLSSSTTQAKQLLGLDNVKPTAIILPIKIHNGTSLPMKYNINGEEGVLVEVKSRGLIDRFALIKLTYIKDELSNVEFLRTNLQPISSIEIKDNGKEKLLSQNDIDYFKAMVRSNLSTYEQANNCTSIQLTLRFENSPDANRIEFPILTADLTIDPKNPTLSTHFDYLYTQLTKDNRRGIILPLKLYNGYNYNIIYSTESIKHGSIDAASCDDSTSKTIAPLTTHDTFGTALLEQNDQKNPNEIMNIVLQHYGNNKKIETLCVKTHTRWAPYSALYGKLRLCAMDLLNQQNDVNNEKNIFKDVNQESGHFLQINLAPEPKTLWIQNSVAPFEGSLTLYDKNKKVIYSSVIQN